MCVYISICETNKNLMCYGLWYNDNYVIMTHKVF